MNSTDTRSAQLNLRQLERTERSYILTVSLLGEFSLTTRLSFIIRVLGAATSRSLFAVLRQSNEGFTETLENRQKA
jgi:hypothetical protein